MSVIGRALRKFFIWDVTIEPFVSDDKYGKPAYGTSVPYKAKIERQERIVRTGDMQTDRSRRLIYLYTKYTGITTKDRITLPTGFEPLQPKLLDVRLVHDHKSIHHVVLET